MTPIWSLYIEPLLCRLGPGRVLQISPEDAEDSVRLLKFGRENGWRVEIIATRPSAEFEEALQAVAGESSLHKLRPLKGVLVADHPDVVIIDREPNWWTVVTLLGQFRELSAERGQPFPLFLVRHTAWPYGRRDMYPKPELVTDRQPLARQGLDPDQTGLVEEGINAGLPHATHEGGPRNGVLSAIEDFIAVAPFEVGFWNLPFFNGLGVLAPKSRVTPEVQAVIDSFFAPESLLEASKAMELESMRAQLRLAQAESRLQRRSGALRRARDLLARYEADVVSMSKQLAASPMALTDGSPAKKAKPDGPAVSPPEPARDLATLERSAVELAGEGRAEEALARLQPLIEELPRRPKGWRSVTAVLAATSAPEARADIWIACLQLWSRLTAGKAEGADDFGSGLAIRLFTYLTDLLRHMTPADADSVGVAWRLARRLYAEPAFGDLAVTHPQPFADFVKVSGDDLYLKAEGKHGANLSACIYDALDLFAAPSHRARLVEVCKTEMASLHGGLETATEAARRLLDDPEFHRPVIVCGFHHSGTRLLARQLAALGLKQQINIFQYEWHHVVQLNGLTEPACLDPGRLGSGEQQRGLISAERLAFRMALTGLKPGEPWGFKDPRNGLTMDAWLKVFPGARIVNLMRDPVATIGTLPKIYDKFVRLDDERPTETQFWAQLWEASVKGARRAMREVPDAIEIRFEELCADPLGVLGRVVAGLGLETEVTAEKLADIAIESGKADVRDKVKARLPAAEFEALEALARSYGYP